jgi:hypothetical protein
MAPKPTRQAQPPGKVPMQAYLRDENDIGTMSHFTLRPFY